MRIEAIAWDGSEPAATAARIRRLAPELGEVTDAVAEIIEAVGERGDAALTEFAERFDEAPAESVRVEPGLVEAATSLIEASVRDALVVAARNIARLARAQAEAELRPVSVELDAGQRIAVAAAPVASAAVYVPGGKGAYPSSVLMGAVPARIAGVPRIAVASPPAASGRPADVVLAACAIAGIEEVYSLGGAQAIAALALGTESVQAVDVIVGPGNRYVTEAKRLLAGRVGVDGIAGPSELAVVADGTADPERIALDLCAQAEHGDDGLLAVIATDEALLNTIAHLTGELAGSRPSVRKSTAGDGVGAGPRARPRPGRRARAGAPRADVPGGRRGQCAGPRRGLRVRRLGGRDRVRRLRRGFQPRAADRRRRALWRAAGAGRFHAPDGRGLRRFGRGSRIGSQRGGDRRRGGLSGAWGVGAGKGEAMSERRTATIERRDRRDGDRAPARTRWRRVRGLRPASVSSTTCSRCSRATAASR